MTDTRDRAEALTERSSRVQRMKRKRESINSQSRNPIMSFNQSVSVPRTKSQLEETKATLQLENKDINVATALSIGTEMVEEARPEMPIMINVAGASDNSERSSGFAKISRLISEEQRLAIEASYRVDAALVDSEKLERNMTVLDKKSIQCKICTATYSRMDKCKVTFPL